MREINFTVDKDANQAIQELMSFYKMKSETELLGWGLKLALISASADNSGGEWELIVRNGKTEKKVSYQ